MSIEQDRQTSADDLALQQGRWFESDRPRPSEPSTGHTAMSVRTRSKPARRPFKEREDGQPTVDLQDTSQLVDRFLAVVSGQVAMAPTTFDEEKRRKNVEIMYRYIEYENARDYENMEKLFHPTEFRSKTYFGNDPISPKAHTRMLLGLFRSFPDWFMVINEIIAADDEAVVALITGRGTQYEEFAGRPPKDHQIAIPTLHAIKVREGLIVEHRHINPFEDIFANQIMAPLTEDIMAVRAQQGFDSGMAQRAYDAAIRAGAAEDQLGEIKLLVETKKRQCQVLLKGTLRRCAMIAPVGEIYCEHHQHHGYGIDGIDD